MLWRNETLITASMSGQVIASDFNGNVLDQRRDHSKYVVKVAGLQEGDTDVMATAAWDNKVHIYRPSSPSAFIFGDPIGSISLPTKPEAMLLIRHPETSEPIIILSRTDSNFIFFYTAEREPRLLGKQNLAPHSNAWVAFTPSSLAICPTDSTLIAVGTNSLPHMKLLIVRLLIPPYTEQTNTSAQPMMRRSLLDDTLVTETQASQARAALAVADREAAAIQIHTTTMAPQTAYSTPAIAWRPDGSGVFVNGDDGAIRGIEASTGKVISTLKGHEEGSKVRCLWAGKVEDEEWLVSGGFDQQLIIWNVEGSS
jgi:WD40 repeat protein